MATLHGNTGLHAKSVGLVGNSCNSVSTAGGGAGGTHIFSSRYPLCFKLCHPSEVQSVPSACVKTEEQYPTPRGQFVATQVSGRSSASVSALVHTMDHSISNSREVICRLIRIGKSWVKVFIDKSKNFLHF